MQLILVLGPLFLMIWCPLFWKVWVWVRALFIKYAVSITIAINYLYLLQNIPALHQNLNFFLHCCLKRDHMIQIGIIFEAVTDLYMFT